MPTQTILEQESRTDSRAIQMNWLELVLVLVRARKTIVASTLACTFLGIVFSLLLPKSYTAVAKVLPPAQMQSSSAAAALGQIGLGALSAKELGLKNPNDLYVGMLRSRSVADGLIERFGLGEVYKTSNSADARQALEVHSTIISEKEGLISVAVTDHDAARAARVANGYVEELIRLSQRLAITEASQRRLFFEQQLEKTKNDLATAEVALRSTQERTGLLEPHEQARAMVESVVELKARIAAAEIRLQSMKSFATENNPDVVRSREELAGMRVQMSKLEHNPLAGNGDIQVATGKVPAAGLEFTRKLREVKYQETLLELLARQFEAAKLDEAKNAAVIQVVDTAIPPEKKSGPRRTVIVLLSLFTGLLGSCLWTTMGEAYLRMKAMPEHADRLQAIENLITSWH